MPFVWKLQPNLQIRGGWRILDIWRDRISPQTFYMTDFLRSKDIHFFLKSHVWIRGIHGLDGRADAYSGPAIL